MTRLLTIILLFLATSASAIRDKGFDYVHHKLRGQIFLEADGGGKCALREFRKAKRARKTEEIKDLIIRAKTKRNEYKGRD